MSVGCPFGTTAMAAGDLPSYSRTSRGRPLLRSGSDVGWRTSTYQHYRSAPSSVEDQGRHISRISTQLRCVLHLAGTDDGSANTTSNAISSHHLAAARHATTIVIQVVKAFEKFSEGTNIHLSQHLEAFCGQINNSDKQWCDVTIKKPPQHIFCSTRTLIHKIVFVILSFNQVSITTKERCSIAGNIVPILFSF